MGIYRNSFLRWFRSFIRFKKSQPNTASKIIVALLRTCLKIPILVGAEVTKLKLFQENAGSWTKRASLRRRLRFFRRALKSELAPMREVVVVILRTDSDPKCLFNCRMQTALHLTEDGFILVLAAPNQSCANSENVMPLSLTGLAMRPTFTRKPIKTSFGKLAV